MHALLTYLRYVGDADSGLYPWDMPVEPLSSAVAVGNQKVTGLQNRRYRQTRIPHEHIERIRRLVYLGT